MQYVQIALICTVVTTFAFVRKLVVRKVGRPKRIASLEKPSFYNTRLVVSQLATTLLLRPQLAADALPAVSCTGKAIVLATAQTRAGSTAVGTTLIVGLIRVGHRIVAHWGGPGRSEWVAHG
jgi:hypothetical protein